MITVCASGKIEKGLCCASTPANRSLEAKPIKLTKAANNLLMCYNRQADVTTEVAAMMFIPTGDKELLNATIKILNGYNCNPFLVNKNNKK